MKNPTNFPKVVFMMFCIGISCMAMPSHAQAQSTNSDPAVVAAENSINNYFKAILAGQSVESAQNFINSIMQTLTSTSDQNTVYAYYEKNAITTSETEINNYLKAVLANQSVPNANTFITGVTALETTQADSQTVYAYYEKSAITTSETEINNYLKAVLANQSVPNANTFITGVTALETTQADSQTVYAYYEKSAITTSETEINNYFKAVLANQSVPNANTFINGVTALETVQADAQTVYAYYEKSAITTSETEINNYLKAVLANQSVPNANTFINGVTALETVQADAQTVYAYYEKSAITTSETEINNYFKAVLANQSVPNANTFINGVTALETVQADAQTVYAYYEKSAITTSETEINNYFKAVLANQSVPNANTFINGVTALETVQADSQTVYAYYEKSAIITSETEINNYLKAVLANQSVPNANTFINGVTALETVQADAQTVYAYYEKSAITTSETEINNYFKAVLANQSVPNANTFINGVTALETVQADSQTVYAYYEKSAIITSETEINNYLKAVLANQSVPNANTFINGVTALETVQADAQTVYAYYEKNAITTSETEINNYFKAVLANQSVPNANTFINGVTALETVQADSQTVYAYYEKNAVTTAETQITNYFNAVLAGNNVPNAQTFINAVMASVLATADQQTVYAYYTLESLYTAAEIAINKYQAAPNTQTLQAAAQAVAALKPYNSTVLPGQTLGVFDQVVNQLMTVVSGNTQKVDDISFVKGLTILSQQVSPTPVAVYGNDLLVADPQASNGGAINEYTKTAGQWVLKHAIQPSDVQPTDNFGTSMVENKEGSLLAVANSPAGAAPSIYIFNNSNTTSNNTWVQENKIDLQSVANLSPSQMTGLHLAMDNVLLVVGIPSVQKVLVFSRTLSGATASWQYEHTFSPSTSTSTLAYGESVDIMGSTVAIGAPNMGKSSVPSQVFLYSPNGPSLTDPYSSWFLLPSTMTSNDPGFGVQVGLGQGPTVVIGDWNGTTQDPGKIWIYNSTVSNGALSWDPTPQQLPVLAPLAGTSLGDIFKVNNGQMVIEVHGGLVANSSSTKPVTYDAVYQFNAAGDNNWDWQYTTTGNGTVSGPVDIAGYDLAVPLVNQNLFTANKSVMVVSPIATSCQCTNTPGSCGSSGAGSQCTVNERIVNHVCNIPGCDGQPAFYCEADSAC